MILRGGVMSLPEPPEFITARQSGSDQTKKMLRAWYSFRDHLHEFSQNNPHFECFKIDITKQMHTYIHDTYIYALIVSHSISENYLL